MPKVFNTRKQRADQLLNRVIKGPAFSESPIAGEDFTAKEAETQYRRWAASWIVEELRDLIPELRKGKVPA